MSRLLLHQFPLNNYCGAEIERIWRSSINSCLKFCFPISFLSLISSLIENAECVKCTPFWKYIWTRPSVPSLRLLLIERIRIWEIVWIGNNPRDVKTVIQTRRGMKAYARATWIYRRKLPQRFRLLCGLS